MMLSSKHHFYQMRAHQRHFGCAGICKANFDTGLDGRFEKQFGAVHMFPLIIVASTAIGELWQTIRGFGFGQFFTRNHGSHRFHRPVKFTKNR